MDAAVQSAILQSIASVISGLVAGGFVVVGVRLQFRRQSEAASRALRVAVSGNKEAAVEMTPEKRQAPTPFEPGRPDPGWLKHSIWDAQFPYVVQLFDEGTLSTSSERCAALSQPQSCFSD
jgi:hypothetical protein